MDRSLGKTGRVCTVLEFIGTACVLLMVLANCLDVLGSKLLNMPVPGVTELIGLLQIVAISYAMAMTQFKKGHIAVDMLVMRLSTFKRNAVRAVVTFLGLVLFILLTWQSIDLGNDYLASGEVTGTIVVPYYPFAYAMAVPMAVMSFLLFRDMLKIFKKEA